MFVSVLVSAVVVGVFVFIVMLSSSNFILMLTSLMFAVLTGLYHPRLLTPGETLFIALIGLLLGGLIGALLGWGGYALVHVFL